MGIRWAAFCAVLVFANLPVITWAQASCPGIHVKILSIRNSTGAVACALFESPAGFPTEDIPPGRYALAVIHDENMNGKLDINRLGIPTEGYGFSNDAKAFLTAPTFELASFAYDGRNVELTLSLNY